MAVETGVNSGFVTVAPSIDPLGTTADIEQRANGIKATSPAGSNKVTELGFWQDYVSNPANDYAIGIYSHNAGDDLPGNLLASGIGTLSANTAGWYTVVIDYSLTASTIYWIVVQTDGINNNNTVRYNFRQPITGKLVIDQVIDSLPDPYATEGIIELDNYTAAFYAKYEAVGGVTHQLSGSVDSQSALTGTLNLTQRLSGSLNSSSHTSGVLRLIHGLSGSLNSSSAVSGTIRLIHGLSGALQSVSTAAGTMRLIQRLSGAINSISAMTGTLNLLMRISGTIESHSHLIGTLVDDTIANGIVRIVGIAKSLKMSGTAISLKIQGVAKSLKVRK